MKTRCSKLVRFASVLGMVVWALGPWAVAQAGGAREAPRNARELATFSGDKVAFTGVAFSPDGQRLVAGGVETTAKVWDLRSGREVFTIPGPNAGTFAVAYSPDGRQFLTGGDYGASLWDAETGRLVRTLPPRLGADWLESGPLRRHSEWHGQRVEVVAFSLDGKRVLTGADDGKVIVWDAASGQSLLTLGGGRSGNRWIHAAGFSPDGLNIAFGSFEGQIAFWDAQAGHALLTLTGHTGPVESLAYFPEGSRIVTASHDGTARIWDTKAGRELLAFRGHRGAVMCVAVSPDGRRVATGSHDGSARVWDAETGQEQLVLQGHKSALDGIAFSPDGRRVATTSFDQTVKIWDVAPEVGSVVPGKVSDVRLESDYIPLAMRLEGDPLKREIHSVRFTGNVPTKGDGAGEIWLDTRLADLNTFGDVVRRVGPEPAPIRVELRYVATNTGQSTNNPTGFGPITDRLASRGFRLYDLVFPGGALGSRLQLVLGTATLGPHRLLASGPAPSIQEPYLKKPGHIVELVGNPPIRSALPDAPLGREVDLTGYYTAVDGRIRRLEVQGTPGGAGKLAFNPNYITFDPFGEPVMFTMMGYQRHEITLKPAEDADPLGQGRRLYWAVSKDPRNTNRVAVVLGRTEIGPHRLLLYRGDELVFIVPAHAPDRRRQEIQAAEIAALSAGEQQAIADLRAAIGSGFRCEIEKGQAVALYFTDNSGRIPPAGVLARLPNLRSLDFMGGRFGAAGLADLGRLPHLKHLMFSGSEFQPEGLAVLKDLRQLESLSFRHCGGITDEGLGHLAGLTGLKWLVLNGAETQPRSPDAPRCLTDAGMARLRRLTQLETLELLGQDLSDASVPVLTGMTELQQLTLSGRGWTDAGLRGLAGLQKLHSLRLLETGVTTNGVAALKERLPELQVEAWSRDTHD